MKRFIKIETYFLLLAVVALSLPATAQQHYELMGSQSLKVAGTSTLHDWEMVSEKPEGSASITLSGERIKEIVSLSVTIPVNTLKSGKSGMDENAYKALRAKQHPNIHFELTRAQVDDLTIFAGGRLTIAGTTRPVEFKVDYRVSGKNIRFKGSLPVTFSQFNMDPPTAVFGTIKTGNDLNISFETFFKQSNN